MDNKIEALITKPVQAFKAGISVETVLIRVTMLVQLITDNCQTYTLDLEEHDTITMMGTDRLTVRDKDGVVKAKIQDGIKVFDSGKHSKADDEEASDNDDKEDVLATVTQYVKDNSIKVEEWWHDDIEGIIGIGVQKMHKRDNVGSDEDDNATDGEESIAFDFKKLMINNDASDYVVPAEVVAPMTSRPSPDSFQIFVKSLSFGSITLDVEASETIKEVGKKIRRKLQDMFTGFDVDLITDCEQKMTFKGKPLEPDSKVGVTNSGLLS